jgi:hypothetical protein
LTWKPNQRASSVAAKTEMKNSNWILPCWFGYSGFLLANVSSRDQILNLLHNTLLASQLISLNYTSVILHILAFSIPTQVITFNFVISQIITRIIRSTMSDSVDCFPHVNTQYIILAIDIFNYILLKIIKIWYFESIHWNKSNKILYNNI